MPDKGKDKGDRGGHLYVADTGNNQLRKITTTGKVTTLPVSFPTEPNRSVRIVGS